jgi:AsmA protein
MLRALKIILGIILALIILLASAIFIITRVIDPNDFKPQISAAAREHANLDLAIPGNLAWTFWPYLGIEVGRTEVRIADEEELFAAFDEVRTSIAVLPLLRGSVELSGIHLAGLELNLVENDQGANWERIAPAGDDTPEQAATEDTGAIDLPISIPLITLTDGRVRYLNTVDSTDIRIEQLNLNARDVSLTKAFPIELSLRYQDQDDIRIDLAMSTTLGMELDKNLFRLDQMQVETVLAGLTTLPVRVVSRQSIEAALDEDRITIRDLVTEAIGTRTTGQLELTQLSTKPVFRGQLAIAPFDANAALKAIGEAPIETSDPAALKKISVDMTFSGPENSIMLNPLSIGLDNSRITGQAGITDLDTGHILFDLTLDRLVADGYLPPNEDIAEDPALVASTAILPPLSSDPLLPLEDLRALKVDGTLRIGALLLSGIEMSDLTVAVRANDGVLELTEAGGQLMQGTLASKASLDARTDKPVVSFHLDTRGVQIQPIVQMALDEDLFTGLLDMTISFRAEGNSEQALADSGKGALNMTLSRGTLRGVNMQNVLVGGINDMLADYQVIANFLPDISAGRMPRVLRNDTEVVQLIVAARIEELVAHVDDLRAELDRGTLAGKGFLNLRSEAFDFRMGMKVPDLSQNKYIAERSWPLRCRGNLSGDAGDWCGADSAGFRSIGRDITTQLAKDKLLDRFGLEGSSVKEAARDAVTEKAKEEIQEAKDEAKQEVQRRAEDGLRRLLR